MNNQSENIESRELKFEGFEVGEIIKAYDHKPRTWVEDGKVIENNFYLIGRIVAIGTNGFAGFSEGREGEGALVYKVEVMKDTCFENEPREEAFVPMEVALSDWDGRVSKVGEVK